MLESSLRARSGSWVSIFSTRALSPSVTIPRPALPRWSVSSQSPGREIRISRLSFVEIQSVCAMKVRSGFLTVEEAEMQRERLLADIASGEIEVRSVTADHFSSAER